MKKSVPNTLLQQIAQDSFTSEGRSRHCPSTPCLPWGLGERRSNDRKISVIGPAFLQQTMRA